VWEWNETAYGTSRVARGGCWSSSSNKLASSLFSYYPPTEEDNVLGFRVAMIPEPNCATLLICAIIAGLMWRRRR
jgi:formylglycine-generating enzyme required for sulfatase activity